MKIICRTDLPGGIVILTAKFKEGDYETVVDHPPYKDRRHFYDLQPATSESQAILDHRELVKQWEYRITQEAPGTFGPAYLPGESDPAIDFIFGVAGTETSPESCKGNTWPSLENKGKNILKAVPSYAPDKGSGGED